MAGVLAMMTGRLHRELPMGFAHLTAAWLEIGAPARIQDAPLRYVGERVFTLRIS